MNTPCAKHVLCPTGTGTESPGVNYSAEHIDVPTFFGRNYPPTPYGYHTACEGRCISIVSQQDADLCAQRLGKICLNGGGGGGSGTPNEPTKDTFTNTQQVCTIQATGKLVVIPAGIFVGDSQAAADQIALDYANKLQTDPTTPPTGGGPPPPGGGGGGIPLPPAIPGHTPQPPKKPKPPAESQCKPCDDTVGVDQFVISGGVPQGTVNQTWETAPLKCGSWKFEVTGGPFAAGSPQSFINMGLFAGDPGRTPISWESFFDCPQPAWICPCGNGTDCSPQDVQQFGFFPGCCVQTDVTCKYAGCAQQPNGNFLLVAQIYYTCPFADENTPAKNFTFRGTWLGPLPPAP